MDKAITFLVECCDLWMDGFNNNLGMIKIASIKVEHLCWKSSFRNPNFVIKCYVACFFKEKHRRLKHLSRGLSATGYHRIIYNGTPPLIEARLYYLAETLSRDVSRCKYCEGNFHRSSKAYCTLCWLCERVGIASSTFGWTRLVQVTAYVLRFIENSKRKRNFQSGKELPIDVSDLREVTQCWFRLV
jgi:hypothetical protein